MSKPRPFDFTSDGETRIDVNNIEHKKIVVQRNYALSQVLKNGYDADYLIQDLASRNLNCLKCGTNLVVGKIKRIAKSVGWISPDDIPNIKCKCCKTTLKFCEINLVYNISIPRPRNSITKPSLKQTTNKK